MDLLLTCSWDSLQLWFWGGRLSHFWVGHTYNWLVDCQHTWDLPQRDRPLRFEQGRCWSGPGGSEKKIQEGSHILANYTKYSKHQHQHHLFYLELVVPMTVTLVWEGRSCSSSSLRATSCARPEELDHFIQSLFTCSKRISSDKDVVVRMARQHIRDFGNGRPCQSLSTGSKTSVSNALKRKAVSQVQDLEDKCLASVWKTHLEERGRVCCKVHQDIKRGWSREDLVGNIFYRYKRESIMNALHVVSFSNTFVPSNERTILLFWCSRVITWSGTCSSMLLRNDWCRLGKTTKGFFLKTVYCGRCPNVISWQVL